MDYLKQIELMEKHNEEPNYILQTIKLYMQEDKERLAERIAIIGTINGNGKNLITQLKAEIRRCDKMILIYSADKMQLEEYLERMENITENGRRT